MLKGPLSKQEIIEATTAYPNIDYLKKETEQRNDVHVMFINRLNDNTFSIRENYTFKEILFLLEKMTYEYAYKHGQDSKIHEIRRALDL